MYDGVRKSYIIMYSENVKRLGYVWGSFVVIRFLELKRLGLGLFKQFLYMKK